MGAATILAFLSVSACTDVFAMLPVSNKTIIQYARGEDGAPVNVFVGFFLESMGNFKSTDMAFDVDMYLRMSWTDQRLEHNHSEEVVIGKRALREIWVPDLYFPNARKATFQTVTVANVGGVIFPDGAVALSRRITMTVACNLNLQRYPIDTQDCYIKLSSYAHNTSKMLIRWFNRNPISYNQNINLPELNIVTISSEACASDFWYPVTEKTIMPAKFSCLQAHIHLRRSLTYHLVQSYLPTALIVIISWVSFWIDHNAVPARVSLSFTTLLTLSTMGAGLRYALPAVSYAKAIDYWYGICMLFVGGALIEFVAVNSIARWGAKCTAIADNLVKNVVSAEDMASDAAECGITERDENGESAELVPLKLSSELEIPSKTSNGLEVDEETKRRDAMTASLRKKARQCHDSALKVDQLSRIVFPLVFTVFVCIYWMVYLVF